MKLSVSITTYNHEKYIAQALESVLNQKTSFDFEIILGEDDSIDGTREICKKYASDHPDKIKLFLNDRKNVIYINGKPTGRWNFINNLKHAKGDYIALLEGDDYWTDPLKLQKQVDFLDSHPDCAISFHNVEVIYENHPEKNHLFHRSDIKKVHTLRDIIPCNFISTCSTVFRNRLFEDFPGWFYSIPMGDWPLHILNAQHGNACYINEIMAAYRVHEGGVWSTENRVLILKNTIDAAKIIDRYTNFQFKKIIGRSIAFWHLEAAQNLCENDFKGTLYHVFKGVITSPFNSMGIKIDLIALLCRVALKKIFGGFRTSP